MRSAAAVLGLVPAFLAAPARAEPRPDTPAARARILRPGEHLPEPERDRTGPLLGAGVGLATVPQLRGVSQSVSLTIGVGVAPRWVTAFEFDVFGAFGPRPNAYRSGSGASLDSRERYWGTVRYWPAERFWLLGGVGAAAARSTRDVWSFSAGGGFGVDMVQWARATLGFGVVSSTWRWNDAYQVDVSLRLGLSYGG